MDTTNLEKEIDYLNSREMPHVGPWIGKSYSCPINCQACLKYHTKSEPVFPFMTSGIFKPSQYL